jgi:DNA polymerase I-like protein with 3'-5' exonuclease and polymerase domains
MSLEYFKNNTVAEDLKDSFKRIYIFDIEANGLYDQASHILCIVIKNYHTKEVFKFTPENIKEAITELTKADYLIGHNIIDYDVPVIKKFYKDLFKDFKGTLIDTLVMCRQLFNNRAVRDKIQLNKRIFKEDTFKVYNRNKKVYESAVGKHSLESYGLRYNFPKNTFGNDLDWTTAVFSEEMLMYCVQDVELNAHIFDVCVKYLYKYSVPWEVFLLEFQVQRIISEQQRYGWVFDKEKAERLYIELSSKRTELEHKLQEAFKGYTETLKTPEYYTATVPVACGNNTTYNNSKYIGFVQFHINQPPPILTTTYKATTKGQLSDELWEIYKNIICDDTGKAWKRKDLNTLIKPGPLRTKYYPFNPNSPTDIHRELNNKYGWEPKEFNEKDGKPKCGTAILEKLTQYKECKWLCELEVVQDRLEKLAGGKNGGYLAFCNDDDNRVHGSAITLGAGTNRATHSKPHLGQVPAKGVSYGEEFRELFIVPSRCKLVGTDQSAVEMCVLAHYLAEYDDGEFAEAVLDGDPHTRNQQITGIDTRDATKTAFYAVLYGAGAGKISKSLNISIQSAASIKKKLLKGLPALQHLIDKCQEDHGKKGYVRAIDGRMIYTRKAHSALNAKIQSTAAVLAKMWMYIIDVELEKRGIKEYVHQVGWIHDELQFEVVVSDNLPEEVGKISQEAMIKVSEYFSLDCLVKAEYNIGDSWAETH